MASLIEDTAFRYAVKNAFLHNGTADLGAVIGKVAALHKEIVLVKEIPKIKAIVEQVNAMPFEELEKNYKRLEDSYELKARPQREGLPELEWAEAGEPVIVRFAPNPSGSMHLGHARAALLNDAYAKKYSGKLFLRLDDTDPKIKKPVENSKEIFERDLKWLGVHNDGTSFASDKLDNYYTYIRKLLVMGKAYVCSCKSETWREYTKAKKPCPHRELGVDQQLQAFSDMLSHKLKEGQAVVRLKTDLEHKDPSIRDWWVAKIVDVVDHPNPKAKDKHVWPSYNLASAIDDHEMGITLIIRGQEHAQNATKQKYLYEYLGWEYPHAIHVGRIKLEGATLSKSKIKQAVEEGEFSGFDDPRIGSIENLRRRGISPEAIRESILALGINPNDATLSVEALYTANRRVIDLKSPRLTFIEKPVKLDVQFGQKFTAKFPWHEEVPQMGEKTYELKEGQQRLLVPEAGLQKVKKGEVFRLKHAWNVKKGEQEKGFTLAQYVGVGKINKEIVPWLLENEFLDAEIAMPDGSKKSGIVEKAVQQLKEGDTVLLEHFGYCRIDKLGDKTVQFWYAHA
ncbi:MAG: glutamate--tRNA ligase [Candidatus Diapherotrites archaeon]